MSTDQLISLPDRPDVAHEPAFHYYDRHPTPEDLMGESAAQSQLIRYLLNVLSWLYQIEGWFVIGNLNIYREHKEDEYPLAPDVAVFLNVVVPNAGDRALRSWRLYEPGHPPPTVVFEIASEKTWKADLKEKPAAYAAMGVHEYYAYDPNIPPYWPKRQGRLRGWHLHQGIMVEQPRDPLGRIWSPSLNSWLLPDGAWLRLLTPEGQIRLTEGEAERAAKEAERAAKEAERAAKEAERAAKEAERAAKEAERAAKEAAWAKLRELGIDPETLT